jgi:hypothetical protein
MSSPPVSAHEMMARSLTVGIPTFRYGTLVVRSPLQVRTAALPARDDNSPCIVASGV